MLNKIKYQLEIEINTPQFPNADVIRTIGRTCKEGIEANLGPSESMRITEFSGKPDITVDLLEDDEAE